MSIGSETSGFKYSKPVASNAQPTGHFDPQTGLYRTQQSNIVQFKTSYRNTIKKQPDVSIEKWPAIVSIGFAVVASIGLWAGIALIAKSLFF